MLDVHCSSDLGAGVFIGKYPPLTPLTGGRGTPLLQVNWEIFLKLEEKKEGTRKKKEERERKIHILH
jgi:hypothetical protein